jgi:flagellin-like protein
MKFGKNDEAVSPVIGVILMVAITVILAAVIAAFVFGMGPQKQAPQASLRVTGVNLTTAGQPGNYVILEHQGGADIQLSDTKLVVEFKDLNGAVSRVIQGKMDTNITRLQAGDKLQILDATVSGLTVPTHGAVKNPGATAILLLPDTTAASGTIQLTAGGKVTVSLIDVPTGQMISQATINT